MKLCQPSSVITMRMLFKLLYKKIRKKTKKYVRIQW